MAISKQPETKPVSTRRSGGGGRRRLPWGRRITAIDLDGDTLRIVQAMRRGGRVQFTRYAATDLSFNGDGEPSPAARGEAIRAAFRELQVRPRSVVIGLPRAHVMLRTLTLPSAKAAAEVASMVHFQVARDLPFPAEEAVIDFMVLPPTEARGSGEEPVLAGESSEAQTRVLAGVVRQDLLGDYEEMARAAGVKLAAVGLRSLANARCVELCQLAPEERCVAMVSLRAEEVIFDVLLDRTLVFSRVGPVRRPFAGGDGGPRQDGPSSEYIEEVVLEAVRGLHNYEGLEGHGQVTRFIVAGSTGAEETVKTTIEERFGIAGTILNPAALTGLSRQEGNGATGAQAAFGLAHGALDPGGLPFDFLHPKRPPLPRDLGRLRTLGTIAGVAGFLLAVVALRAHLVSGRMADRSALQEQLNLANRNVKTYRLLGSQASTVRTWEQEGRSWLDHLAYLSSLFPPSQDLYVTSISTSSRNTINLAVKVRNGDILNRLDGTLRAAGYAVKPPAITPANDAHGYRFQANLELEVPAGMEVKLGVLNAPERPADDASLTGATPASVGGSEPPTAATAASPSEPATAGPDDASASPPAAAAASTENVVDRASEEANSREARARRREEWAARLQNGERPPGAAPGRPGRPGEATRSRGGLGERPSGGGRPPGSGRSSRNE